ncbi:MAG: Rrf2 family transcriptional regulator [Peptococcaceae bacterium]|nr:Rrf2 family transcriptional regulator [Peptococcaceae bacterium]
MQLNQATDYAFRAVLYLANNTSQEIIPAQTIADAEEIPMRFLLKIMRSLIQNGIVKSYRGIEGGYALAKLPEEITLLDVVQAVEGPVHLNRCLIDPKYCSKNGADTCAIHEALENIEKNLVSGLRNRNFAELVGKTQNN